MKPRIEVKFTHTKKKAFLRGKPSYSPKENEFLLNHARSGLSLALQAIGLSSGSKVGMMVYNCHTVMSAIAQSGCEIVFIDVTEELKIDLEDLRKKSTTLDALIVTHLFGIVNDVEAIHKQFPKINIIEDCAHLYGKTIVGDFGVYSIGQGKLPSLGDGGILIVNNANYLNTVKILYNQLPEYSFLNEVKLFLKLFITSLLYKDHIYSFLTLPLKAIHGLSSSSHISYFPFHLKKMSRGVRSMLALEKEKLEKKIELRLENASDEKEKLKNNPLVKNILLGNNAFMLIAHSTNPDSLKKHYTQKKVETATHFANCIYWAKNYGYSGECPKAERLVNELLMIPIYR